MFEIYQAETYSMTDAYKKKMTESSDNIDEIVNKLTKDKHYHLHLSPTENYKFFVDLDKYEETPEIFIDKLNQFLNEKYDIKLNYNDYSITNNTGKKGSHHLVVPSIYCTTKKQKEIMENFYKFTDKKTQKGIDLSVYCRRPFRLPNQTKGKIMDREKMKLKPPVYEEIQTIKTPHKIVAGEMKDFVLNYIEKNYKNIEDIKYILSDEDKMKIEKKQTREIMKNKEGEKKLIKNKIQQNEKINEDNDIIKIVNLLDILDPKYYNDYSCWLNVLSILKKYEKNTGKQTKNIFIEFSKKSPDYNDKSLSFINTQWEYLDKREITINIESLFYYAKESNLTAYKEITRNYHKNFKIDITEKYLVEKIKELAGDLFFYKNKILYCYDTKLKFWFENQSGILKNYVNDELFDFMIHFITDAIEDNEYFNKQKKELRNLCLNLNGRERIFKTFEQRYENEIKDDINFDEKYYLLGFNNGVYDLKNNEFRNYRYDDYMTTKTGYNYRKSTDEEKEKMEDIINKIESDEKHKNLLLQLLATGLIGKSYQKFVLFNGVGSNGKGFLTCCMSSILGNYFYQGKVSCLCECEKSGGNPEVANMDKKRYIVFSEPKESKKINNGIMKSWTGDKKVNARFLFDNKTQISMMGTIVLECNKKIYLEDEPTYGEIRRIIDYPFLSRFVEEYEKDEINDDKRIYLKNKSYDGDEFLNKYKFGFLDILIKKAHHFLTIDKEEFDIPKTILDRSNEYINKSFPLLNLLKECTDFTNNKKDYIQIKDIHTFMKSTDFYINSSKEEKRKMTKKYMIEFYQCNKETSKYYVEDFSSHIDSNKIHERNILTHYKFNEDFQN